MFALTEDAAEVAEAIVAETEVPQSAVLRIAVRPHDQNGSGLPQLELVLVDKPARNDVVLEDAPVAVDPKTAELLEDRVLDAEIEDGEAHFSLLPQPGNGR
jgi:Fe-S cluster assembly iron-binding protein IscA